MALTGTFSAMKIRATTTLSDEEREILFGWGTDIFGEDGLNLRWRPKNWHIIAEVDDCPVSHVGLIREIVPLGGRTYSLGGVGGVVTIGEKHGRGYASQCLRFAGEFMSREWEVDFGMLFCREPLIDFYARLGWETLNEEVEVEQPSGRLIMPLEAMILPLRNKLWPIGKVSLESYPW